MQTTSSRVWTPVDVSISNDDIHYSMGTRIPGYTCINSWGNYSNFLWFFNWHAPYIINVWEIDKFSSISHLYMISLNDTRPRIMASPNLESWLILEYHFHPIVHISCPLFFSPLYPHFLCVSKGFHSNFLKVNPNFILQITYSSVTNIDSCSDQFVLRFFCCIFSIFKAYCFELFYSDTLICFKFYQFVFLFKQSHFC